MLKEIIDQNKVTILLQDSDAKEVNNATLQLSVLLDEIKDYNEDTFVISTKSDKIKTFKLAMSKFTLMDYMDIAKLNKNDLDLSKLYNTNVIIDLRNLDISNPTSNAFLNILKIKEQAAKLILITTIGKQSITKEFLVACFELLEEKLNYSLLHDINYLNNLLLTNFTILKDETLQLQITKNYFSYIKTSMFSMKNILKFLKPKSNIS